MTHEAHDLLGRIDTTKIYPPFLEALNSLLNMCAASGQLYVATSGYRSYEVQEGLYAQGRTKPGMMVTKARGGQSAHNFGIAVDFAPHTGTQYIGKLNPDYDDERYIILDQETKELGLEWGGRWATIHDSPHVQWPHVQLATLHGIHLKGGLAAVWAYLDKVQK